MAKTTCDFYKPGFFAVSAALLIALFLLSGSFMQQSSNEKNKEIALQFLKTAAENEDSTAFEDEYFDQGIVLEFPPAFSITPDHENTVAGKEDAKKVIAAWQTYTEQHIDVVSALSENGRVAVLASQDRVFEDYTGIPAYENDTMAYFFYFENGKITRVVSVFDVFDAVEAFKHEKYPAQ